MGEKGRKADESWNSGKKLRIKFIHEFVEAEMGDQSAMLVHVNDKLRKLEQPTIELKTLQSDLQYLNSGAFLSDPERRTFTPFADGKYFHAILNKKKGKYYYEGANIPTLDRLSKEEEMTLPFLTSLLNPYGDVPAFKKFLDESSTLFDRDLRKVDTRKAFSVSGPKFTFKGHRSRMISNVLKLLGHIESGEVITFEYADPSLIEVRKKHPGKKRDITLKPLCVRLYQNLYYLTGSLENNSKKVLNYRIDLIVESSIHPIRLGMDTMKVKTFNVEQARKDSDLQQLLKRPLGVWLHGNDSFAENIVIRFHGWAAKHLLTLQIHPLQQELPVPEDAPYADFQFTLFTRPTYLADVKEDENARIQAIQNGTLHPETRPYVAWLNRYPEAGYIFGRYINYIELIEIQPI
jgi:hypothetical protein